MLGPVDGRNDRPAVSPWSVSLIVIAFSDTVAGAVALLLFVICRPPFSLYYCCDGSVGVPLILGARPASPLSGSPACRPRTWGSCDRASSPSSDDTAVVATALFPED